MDHSEVKHLPKVDHTPAELDEPSALLLSAADLIERQGWKQCHVGEVGGPFCMEGAIAVASGRLPTAMVEALRVPSEALRRIRKAIGTDAFRWNDEDGRSKEEVVAKLRAVALGL